MPVDVGQPEVKPAGTAPTNTVSPTLKVQLSRLALKDAAIRMSKGSPLIAAMLNIVAGLAGSAPGVPFQLPAAPLRTPSVQLSKSTAKPTVSEVSNAPSDF